MLSESGRQNRKTFKLSFGVIYFVLVIFVIVCLLVIFTLSHFTHLTDLDKSDRLYLKRSLDITMLMFTLALLSSVPEV